MLLSESRTLYDFDFLSVIFKRFPVYHILRYKQFSIVEHSFGFFFSPFGYAIAFIIFIYDSKTIVTYSNYQLK